jgi:hypothetical protein
LVDSSRLQGYGSADGAGGPNSKKIESQQITASSGVAANGNEYCG